ncbi:MAG TPA: DUF5916 domain-containing protein [Kofleriaceae bacterium]|nr:DUF5916 domain-containing protein [Kofleriaceae bacterium]
MALSRCAVPVARSFAVSIALALALAATPATAHAEPVNPLLAPRSLTAHRTPAALQLDGRLDEPAWDSAAPGEQFMQSSPAPGEPAHLHTTFKVLFDDDALYVGVRLEDPAAAAIQAPLGRRDDENSSDWCFVEIDSRRDRRTAYSFGVNPAGMQVDGVFVNDTDYDSSWNAVWEAATRIDGGGWTAEYRIPFSILAHHDSASGEPMRWGINVYRSNPHTGESSNWSPRMPQLAGVVSLFNELVVDAAPRNRRLDITPYALVQAERAGSPEMRAGVDANIGLSPSAELAATVLPDFGQVEADPTQLNLTAFELFQQERRPFFTEGIDAFRFDTSLPLVSRDDSFSEEAPFYSRRIGRAPEGDIPPGATAPAATRILGAAKRFAHTSPGWRTGVLATVTDGADAVPDGSGPGSVAVAVAARSEAAVARVVREADAGNAAFGLFASALHREVSGPLADALPSDAVALGLDGRLRWAHQGYELRGWALATEQLGTAASIARLAAQPWHNFLRSDAPRLRLDDGATHLTGIAGEGRLQKTSGDLLGGVFVRAISPGYDVNGIGFQRNSDWLLVATQWGYQRYRRGLIRHWRIGTDNAGLGWSFGGERRAAVVDAALTVDLRSYWGGTLTLQHELSSFSTEWLRGGPALLLPPRELAKLSVHTDSRRTSTASLDLALTTEPGSASRTASVSPSLTVRMSDHVAAVLGASYQDQQIGWQLVAGPGLAPADTYLVGRVHQRAVSLSLQADLAISPRMIIQLYAQPFATIGRYDRYALLADPRASRPADRFAALSSDQVTADDTMLTIDGQRRFTVPRPDGLSRTLIASAIARWELRPGSFLTAVLSHHGDTSAIATGAQLGNQLGRVLTESGGDVLLIKLGWRWAP